jgi:hypothetical protein
MSENKAFEALESYGDIVALMSGVRVKFLEAGWTPDNAEKATIAIFAGLFNGNR